MLSVGVTRIIYELQYESDDPVRDAEWRQKGMKHGIEIKQLKLTKDEIDAVLNTILEKTSLRRL
jgi:hypothetical protein